MFSFTGSSGLLSFPTVLSYFTHKLRVAIKENIRDRDNHLRFKKRKGIKKLVKKQKHETRKNFGSKKVKMYDCQRTMLGISN